MSDLFNRAGALNSIYIHNGLGFVRKSSLRKSKPKTKKTQSRDCPHFPCFFFCFSWAVSHHLLPCPFSQVWCKTSGWEKHIYVWQKVIVSTWCILFVLFPFPNPRLASVLWNRKWGNIFISLGHLPAAQRKNSGEKTRPPALQRADWVDHSGRSAVYGSLHGRW